jgi:hypothetical protein
MAAPNDVSPQKLLNTYRSVTAYYVGLEQLAIKFQTEDKGRAAFAAVGLTIRFLQRLNVDRSLVAALLEAQFIIDRETNGRTTKKQQMAQDTIDSVAVELQLRCKVKLDDALKTIVGNNPEAANHLRDFRKNMRAGRNAPAQALFDEWIKEFREMPPEAAMERALRASANMRGKKV